MTLYSDHIGAFVQGVTDPEELRRFIQQKFSEAEIQYAYEKMLADTKTVAKAEKDPPPESVLESARPRLHQ